MGLPCAWRTDDRPQRLCAQLDCPDLALERHTAFQGEPLGKFIGFAEAVIDTINTALLGIPKDRVRLHACWGNYEGPHDCDVPMAEILPTIMKAQVGGFVLPLANPRHAHEHRAIKEYPLKDDQVLVAGVIDTVTNFVEHPEVVADRLERISHAVGDPKRVIAGTDCGFDTSAGMGHVAEEVVWAKLRSSRRGPKSPLLVYSRDKAVDRRKSAPRRPVPTTLIMPRSACALPGGSLKADRLLTAISCRSAMRPNSPFSNADTSPEIGHCYSGPAPAGHPELVGGSKGSLGTISWVASAPQRQGKRPVSEPGPRKKARLSREHIAKLGC